VDDDGRLSCLVDLFLHHRGSLETVENLICGVKARADREMENWWGSCRTSSTTGLWIKHVVGLLSDIINNGLRPAYFVSIFQSLILIDPLVSCSNHSTPGSQDMKETSRIKSSFIHATRGGWEQLLVLKDQLLESQEKLLKAYKDLIALEEEKKAREAALVEAR